MTSEVITSKVSTVKPARIQTPLGRILIEEGRKMTWLADRLGVSKQEVGRWVHGVHVPAEATRQEIARTLGRTLDELFPADSAEEAAA